MALLTNPRSYGDDVGTHEVFNQPRPLVDYDVFGSDVALVYAVQHYGATASLPSLHALGELAGSAQAALWATQANTFPPILRTHDRYGHRIDEVEFHPAWHALLDVAVSNGLHGTPWTSPQQAPHVTRAAGFLVWSQAESGHGCPISMTYAAIPALRADAELAKRWEPQLASSTYDPELRPPAEKAGLLAGMAMTEKQGGSDVRANTTRARPTLDGTYLLTGHKWFVSAPMNDLFLVLAQAPRGLSCFVVPRMLDDGTRNAFRIQRLKDKLGNRSNASAEIELEDAIGWRLGDEGRGIATIIEMVAATRLDCVLGSAALMRRATAEAIWHCSRRRAFGALLIDQESMAAVLADLALESEAATTLGMRLARTFDESNDEREQALRRIMLPMAKFWVTKRAESHVGEALECLGGNGYVEDSGMPRLYREAPVNAIWEGSGNVQALDLLRVLERNMTAYDAWRSEVAAVDDGRLDAPLMHVDALVRLRAAADARQLTVRMGVLLQAALLVQHAPQHVSDAYCATRLPTPEGMWGMLPAGIDARRIVARAGVAM
jgi:putative acyl-CoA dehydrogenase